MTAHEWTINSRSVWNDVSSARNKNQLKHGATYPVKLCDRCISMYTKEVDIVSWDNYPSWHNDYESTEDLAEEISFVHDINRSLKNGQPFLMMESTPSLVNW